MPIDPNAFIRPSPAAGTLGGVAAKTRETMLICEAAGFDVILVETVGIGQSETAVADMTDFFLVLMLPGAGDELQGIKKGVVELADMIAVNKADGDNVKRAKAAAGEYRAALHILTPRSPTWAPPVVTYSALTGDGIAELWEQVLAHRQQLTAIRRVRRAAARAAGQMDVGDAGRPLPSAAEDRRQAQGARCRRSRKRSPTARCRRRSRSRRSRRRSGCERSDRPSSSPASAAFPARRSIRAARSRARSRKRRRPAFADVRRVVHIFETSYAAVDRDLPKLIAQHKPDIVLMFGLAARTPLVRIETRARNARSILFPDVTGFRPTARAIAPRRAAAARPRAVRPPARGRPRAAGRAPACRAMPGAISATTSIGARWKRPDPERRWRSSSTSRRSLATPRRPGRKRRISPRRARARRRGHSARAARPRSAV